MLLFELQTVGEQRAEWSCDDTWGFRNILNLPFQKGPLFSHAQILCFIIFTFILSAFGLLQSLCSVHSCSCPSSGSSIWDGVEGAEKVKALETQC